MEQEFPVPNYDKYFVDKAGNIISYVRNSRAIIKPRQIKSSQEGRTAVYLGRGNQFITYRVIAAAKYERWPEPWEIVRHKNGDRFDNSMENIVLGCSLLNVIDDIEKGTRQTNDEYLNDAIERLIQIRDQNQSG
jgi:hypothetical protein